ncbi:MAG: carbohydrate ABC transporter substrate-binding protein [Cyanobacteria bacterium SBLK]|nr:carbohydrate ABC transporter substrate-binding protein [Cyanobacteria bacterium SBLK]
MKIKNILTLFFLFGFALGIVTCSHTQIQSPPSTSAIDPEAKAQNSLEIWWTQGLLPEENEAIVKLTDEWERQSGMSVNLKLIPRTAIASELEKAIATGSVPDIAYPDNAGPGSLFPRWAWQGKLADVTALLEPLQDSFNEIALSGVYYQNHVSQERSYYAVPLGVATTNIHYWRNLLAEMGLDDTDIPRDWQGFWAFWQQASDRLHQNGRKDVFGMGLSMSDKGNDMARGFVHFLDARNVRILNKSGALLLEHPSNRQGLIDALAEYAGFYQEGYVPLGATEWRDSGNNISFLEGQSLMVFNGNLSIPLTQKLPNNPYNQRSRNLYYRQIATRGWPDKLDGTPMTAEIEVKQTAIFADAPHPKLAKQFLAYFLQPEHLSLWLESLKGRFLPPLQPLLESAFWNDPDDPHFAAAIAIQRGATRPPWQVLHPAYSEVNAQKIWQKTLLSILQDGLSPEEAADRAITQIQDIFAQWS